MAMAKLTAVSVGTGDDAALRHRLRAAGATLSCGEAALSYGEVLEGWSGDEGFQASFGALLRGFDAPSFFWEVAPVTAGTLDQPFEFAVIPAAPPGAPDRETFAAQFGAGDEGDEGAVAFRNLGGDARLVTASPAQEGADYRDLAAFLRNAPAAQQNALWRVLSTTIREALSDRPIWVLVAGRGVFWVHLRIEGRPKYYRFAPFRTF